MNVMVSEPLKGISAANVREHFENRLTEQDLADAYAVTHNEFWWVEDNEYDYEEGTQEYKAACAITDEWRGLMDYYKAKIFEILTAEGVTIPETGQIAVLAPFMKKYGYEDANGWWTKL